MTLQQADERVRERRLEHDALSLFSVMWALAALWHLLGNPLLAPMWLQVFISLAAGAVLLWPGRVGPLAALALGGLVGVWEEAPLLSNHLLVTGFVDLALLLAVAVGALRRRWDDRTDLVARFFPVARLCLLAFYSFAALAKLNAGFFDRSVSCAVFYFEESTNSLGLQALQLDGATWLQWAVMVGTAAVELAVPVLLIVRRTRNAGVVLALVFHGVLALDRSHEFFDFSSMLFALFVLFLPPDAGTWMAERVGSVRARLALADERLPRRTHLALAGLPVLVGLAVAVDLLGPDEARKIGWWPWQAYAVATVVLVVRYLRQGRREAERGALRPHHAVFLLIPVLVLANGLTPYLELKTGYGFNMYANLRTVDGDSNHFLIRATLPLTDEQADVVVIRDTNDASLARYAANDYGLTWRQLRAYVAEHPDIRITYERGGKVVALQHAREDPALVEPVPEWRQKVQLFRAIDLRTPERCVPTFGPAR